MNSFDSESVEAAQEAEQFEVSTLALQNHTQSVALNDFHHLFTPNRKAKIAILRMKHMILMVSAMALLSAGDLAAQTLKWSQPHANGSSYSRAGDGKGGLAFVLRGGSTDEAATVTWIGARGHLLLKAEINRTHEDAPVDIVRMTDRELALRFGTVLPGTTTISNVLRRYVKRGNVVTTTDKILGMDEDMPRVPERLTDPLGFFTFASTEVRRYSN